MKNNFKPKKMPFFFNNGSKDEKKGLQTQKKVCIRKITLNDQNVSHMKRDQSSKMPDLIWFRNENKISVDKTIKNKIKPKDFRTALSVTESISFFMSWEPV